MEGLRTYLLSVCSAALLCALIVTLTGEKSAFAKIIKLIAGIFLATVILKPSIEIHLSDWSRLEMELREKSSEAAEAGQRLAMETIAQQASQAVKSRIEQEAAKLGCRIDVTVSWIDHAPREVVLEGEASPYAKNSITAWITENLGIPGEAQIWIG